MFKHHLLQVKPSHSRSGCTAITRFSHFFSRCTREGVKLGLYYFLIIIRSGPRFPGWCATDTDVFGKVKEVGLCADSCLSHATDINFATINLLTQDECMYIFNLSMFLVSLLTYAYMPTYIT